MLLSNVFISLKISLLATLIVLIVGLPIAWALAHRTWRGRTLLDVAVHLPLALPPTVVGYYLLLLIGRNGPVGKLTTAVSGTTLIFTAAAAVLASAVVCLPIFVQAARNALEDVPKETYEAAQMDGAGGWGAVRHIFLPLAWPGIWTGLLLAYSRSLGEFGATLMVAGNIPGRTQTLAAAIYSAVHAGENSTAHLLSLTLTALAGVSIWISLRWRRPYSSRPSAKGKGVAA